MILYTTLSHEDIFPQEHNTNAVQYVKYKDCSICVESLDDGTFQIVHIQSTNPEHFLDAQYQPGNVVQAQDICFES